MSEFSFDKNQPNADRLYLVVSRLKAAEGVDLFDIGTDFSPFASSADAKPD